MSLAQKLERLARLVPGIAGYHDKETSRDTDKTVRLRLASELEAIKRNLEEDKRQLMEERDLSLLPALDRLASKLDKVGNLIKYASRGYRGVFDTYKLNQEKLDELYAFDLRLFDELDTVKKKAKAVRDSHGEATLFKKATQELDLTIDGMEKLFAVRQEILTMR